MSLSGGRPKLPLLSREAETVGLRGPDEQAEFGDQDSILRFYRLGLVARHRSLSSLVFPSGIAYCLLNGTLHGMAEGAHEGLTDHELLAQAFHAGGDACFSALEGGFAAVVKTRDGLLLATDSVGEKSLCWAVSGDVFWFSTSALLLATLLNRPPRQGPAILMHLVLRGLPVGETYFEGIQQLAPGRLLRVTSDGIQQSAWPVERSESPSRPGADALVSAIQSRTGNGPCAVALSGGFDSSALTCVGLSGGTVNQAISLTKDDDPHFQADARHVLELAQQNPGLALDFVPVTAERHWPRDFPVLDQDELGLHAIARHCRDRGYPVLITGDGADELFCGYDRIYRFAHELGGPLTQPRAREAFLSRYAYADLAVLQSHLSSDEYGSFSAALFGYFDGMVGDIRPSLEGARRWFSGHHLFWLLRKADFVTGCHGVESRAPFLSKAFRHLAQGRAEDELLSCRQFDPGSVAYHRSVKQVLKQALGPRLESCLPRSIVERPKQAFPVARSLALDSYQASLSSDQRALPPVGIPSVLHDKLCQGDAGRSAQLLYFSYLSWKESCQKEMM